MVVWNADGSRSEMCGNGLRCVAWHHVRHGGAGDIIWDTDAGPHHCVTTIPSSGVVADVEVAMVSPTFASAAIPTHAGKPLIDAPISLPAAPSGPEVTLRLTAVGMGNPHAVIFGHGEARLVLGPRVQQLGLFPEGVNVGFAEPMEGGFVLHVLERGAGWTQACGTGACAAAAAAVATGRAEQGAPLIIRLPGGDLSVRIDGEGDPAKMQGPARFVFQGEVTLPLE